MLVYIVRHGETDENRMGIIQGQMDTQLNQAGKDQASMAGEALKNVNFIAAYSSDSSRAADTARAILIHHPKCPLDLEPGLRERHMGSLSGTKAPARRPLPTDVESSHSMSKRLTKFWDNTIIPLYVATTTAPATSIELPADSTNSLALREPAVLLVSHGATISKLIRDTLLVEHGYMAACDVSRHGIYNTSISILKLDSNQGSTGEPTPGNEEDESTKSELLSGELLRFASIAHLLEQKDVVTENADILEQQGRTIHRK